MKNLFNSIFSVSILLIFAMSCTISSPFQQQSNQTSTSPTPIAAQTPTSDDESEKLKEKLEELEKKVADHEKQKPPTVVKTVPVIKNTGNFARVNSPNDGFLALRTEPSSDYGDRILQVPHGATVKVLGCQGFRVNVGGRTGRWCRISYEGYIGWAFDGWLVF